MAETRELVERALNSTKKIDTDRFVFLITAEVEEIDKDVEELKTKIFEATEWEQLKDACKHDMLCGIVENIDAFFENSKMAGFKYTQSMLTCMLMGAAEGRLRAHKQVLFWVGDEQCM